MDGPDPFRVLSLPYDAGPDAVRRAFRRAARETHPDRGGSARAFHRARLAYDALAADLDGQRERWQPAPPAPPAPRFPAGLDPAVYPTCPVVVRREYGARKMDYDVAARPAGWRPGPAPSGGTCRARYPARDGAPAFGVWTVPVGASTFRCVFGPDPGG